MNLSKIISHIKSGRCTWISTEHSEEEIFRSRIFFKGIPLEPNVLYICAEGTPSKRADVNGCSFLCTAAAKEKSSGYRFHNCNFILMDTDASPDDVDDEISRLIGEENRLSSDMYSMIRVLHSNEGVQAMIDEAYSVIKNPILLVDSSWKILASSQYGIFDRPDLEAQNKLGYIMESNIAAMKKAHLYEKAREKRYPYYNREPGEKNGWITALVYIHGIEAAHIAASDSNHTFSENDFEYIDFLCRVISLELQKSDFYRTNEALMHSFFLSDLLDDHVHDMSTILNRAHTLSWTMTGIFRVMTLSEERSNTFDKRAQFISTQIHAFLPESHWVIYEGRIVFILILTDASDEGLRSNEKLADFLSVNHLTASISRTFSSLCDTRRFFLESLTAERLGMRFHPDETMHFFFDYICQDIGEIISEKNTISDFYHPAVVQLFEYDLAHRTQLASTLKEYLMHPDDPAKAAADLAIHKNTLFYRMAKIKELFAIDLSDGEERLKIHLTLKFMELEQKS